MKNYLLSLFFCYYELCVQPGAGFCTAQAESRLAGTPLEDAVYWINQQ